MSAPEPLTARERELIAVMLEAIDIPHAATAGDEEVHDRILLRRVMHAVVFLGGLDQEDGAYVAESLPYRIKYLRERLAAYPAEGYKTWDQAVAELNARKASP